MLVLLSLIDGEGCCIQLLDKVFVISEIIKVEAGDSSRSQRLRLITLTDILIILYMTETEAKDCVIFP